MGATSHAHWARIWREGEAGMLLIGYDGGGIRIGTCIGLVWMWMALSIEGSDRDGVSVFLSRSGIGQRNR